MAISEAKKKSNLKWDEENLKRSSISMNKELYEQFDKYCKNIGKSKNGMINELIVERLERDGYLTDQESDQKD